MSLGNAYRKAIANGFKKLQEENQELGESLTVSNVANGGSVENRDFLSDSNSTTQSDNSSLSSASTTDSIIAKLGSLHLDDSSSMSSSFGSQSTINSYIDDGYEADNEYEKENQGHLRDGDNKDKDEPEVSNGQRKKNKNKMALCFNI